MHKVEPNQRVRIINISIAVPETADTGHVSDEISALLTENGIANKKSCILDWIYRPENKDIVVASDEPEEGEVFFRELV